MPTKLTISNERMLVLMAWALARDLFATEKSFLLAIGFGPNNIGNVRKGMQGFTIDHITNACRLTGANANWILGLEGNMLRKPGSTPLEQLQAAVVGIEQEMKARNKTRNKTVLRSKKA